MTSKAARRPRPADFAGIRPLPAALLALGLLLISAGTVLLTLAGSVLPEEPDLLPTLRQTWERMATSEMGILTLVLAPPAFVLSLLDRLLPWPKGEATDRFSALMSASDREALEEIRTRISECIRAGREQISELFDELLRGAVRLRASDIHLSPGLEDVVVTYRVDGALVELCRVPRHLGPKLATRIKVLAHLDIHARSPLDGKLRRQIGEDLIEARVSTLPVERGQRVVLRITRGRAGVPALLELGFSEGLSSDLVRLLEKPQGLFLVSGPVGSGKTTTLYSALQHIHKTRGGTSSLVTLEDPIEVQLPFANQTQINPGTQMSFSQTLRSVLRQDPNVLMLGEIRDRETAAIASQAGLTGHLILSTLHVDRAAGTFPRLLDMGVEPFVLASSVVGAFSQRLLRTLCTNCRKPAKPEGFLLSRLGQLGVEAPPGNYFTSVGCPYCEGKGFAGRSPIGELLVVDDALREAVNHRAPAEELHRLAVGVGMLPLIQSGLACAQAGETSLEEVLRVVG